LKQFLNFGPQTFNIVTKGFTSIWRGAFTGTAGNYERIFEFGPTNTNGGSCIAALRNVTNATVTFLLFPTNSGTPVGSVTATGSLTQGTSYVIIFRYNYITQIADIWINGVSNISASVTTASLVGDRTVSFTYVGRPSDTATYTSMTTSTFATYNRALTDAEILNATTALLDTPVLPNNSTLEIGNLNSKPALSIAGDGRVNVQRLGQTSAVMEWPPAPMTGYVTVLNGGTYVASASSDTSEKLGWYAFDKGSSQWYPSGVYNGSTPGNYIGSVSTNDTNGALYLGEWLQIQTPLQIALASYTLQCASDVTYRAFYRWFILGSRDGFNWFLLDARSGITWSATSQIQTFTLQTPASIAYNYFRCVVNQIIGGTAAAIAEWTLYGTADTQQPLEIAQPTTMKYPLIAPQITGPQNAGVYVPQDFSSSALNVPACFVASGTSAISTPSTGPFANEGSIYFPGVAYMKLGNPAQLAYNWTNFDFTLETHVYLVNTGQINDYHLLSRDSDILLYVQASSKSLILYMAGVTTPGGGGFIGGSVPFNQWAHISASWNSTTQVMTVGVNGSVTSITRTAGTPQYTGTNSINISAWFGGLGYLNGYISNMRFIRGLALYQSAFTPPTSPLQPIQGVTQAGTPYGTVLLLRNAPAPGRVLTQRFAGANSSSVLAFPPGPMTGYSTTINAGYGQGTYVASASSELVYPYPTWGAFDKSTSLSAIYGSGTIYSYWSSSATYPTGGAYSGSVVTVDTLGNTYAGEWIQLQNPCALILSNYVIWTRSDYVHQAPVKFWILGSSDGNTWNLVDSRVGVMWASPWNQTFTVKLAQSYNIYRLVTNITSNTVGTNPVTILEWVLNGTIESVNITADGRVGLGVVAPVQALEVAGNSIIYGNVGIGVTNPAAKLHVQGDIQVRNPASWTVIGANSSGSDRSAIYQVVPFGTWSSTNPIWSFGCRFNANSDFSIWPYDNTAHRENIVTIKPNGYFGIGISNPQSTLHLAIAGSGGPNIRFQNANYQWNIGVGSSEFYVYNQSSVGAFLSWGGASWNPNASDERVKEEISPLSNALDVIIKLEPVTFKYKVDTKKTHHGFIAQNIEKVIPSQIVNNNAAENIKQYLNGEDTVKTYDTDFLIPYLVKSVQELHEMVLKLTMQINSMVN